MLLSLFCNYLYFMVGSHQPMAALSNLLMQIKCVYVFVCKKGAKIFDFDTI